MTNPSPSDARPEILSGPDCWALLRSVPVGRLALPGDEFPEIFPVNHLVDHGTLVIRTDPGTKLSAAAASSPVSFEADGYREADRVAWSVVAKGRLEPVRDTAGIVEAMGLPVHPWQAGPKAFFFRVVPEEMTGRRFTVTDPAQRGFALTPGHAPCE